MGLKCHGAIVAYLHTLQKDTVKVGTDADYGREQSSEQIKCAQINTWLLVLFFEIISH